MHSGENVGQRVDVAERVQAAFREPKIAVGPDRDALGLYIRQGHRELTDHVGVMSNMPTSFRSGSVNQMFPSDPAVICMIYWIGPRRRVRGTR